MTAPGTEKFVVFWYYELSRKSQYVLVLGDVPALYLMPRYTETLLRMDTVEI